MHFRREAILNLLMKLIPIFLLSLFIIPQLIKRQERSKLLQVELVFDVIEKALVEFKRQTGDFPKSSNNLFILEQKEGSNIWKGPFVSHGNLIDPWGVPYKILYNGKRQPCIISFGPNGKLDTTDLDIQKGQAGGDDLMRCLKLSRESLLKSASSK